MQFTKYQLRLQAETALAIGVIVGIWCGCKWWVVLFFSAILFLKRSTALALFTGIILGSASFYWQSKNTGTWDNSWIDHAQKLDLTVKISDRQCSRIKEIKNPYWLNAQLLPPESGTIKIHLKDKVHFGNVIRIHGTLLPKNNRHFRYFYVDSWHHLGEAPIEITSYLLACRDYILNGLLSKINNPMVQEMAAKMFFGAGAGADSEIRRSFVNSGVIHLFSISGMHVALLSGVLLLILRILPFRWRYFTVVFCVTGYVLLSGASPPAIRAGLMISGWCILRSFLLYTPPENLLCFAAVAVLVNEPHLLNDPGVQFSFIITGVLLLGCSRWREWKQQLETEIKLMPHGNKWTHQQERKLIYRNRVLFSIFTCVIAFLGGAAISLAHMDLFVPGSIIANLIITPFLPLFFLVVFLKLLVHPFFGSADIILGGILEYLFMTLQHVAETISQLLTPLGAIRLSATEALLFIILLFLTLSSNTVRKFFICGILIVAMIISWPLRAKFATPEFVVVSGDVKRGTQFIITYPESRRAVIINTAYNTGNYLIADYLRSCGIQEVEIYTANSGISSRRGIDQLKKRLCVKQVFASYDSKRKIKLTSAPTLPASFSSTCKITRNSGEVIIKFARYGEPVQTWRIQRSDLGEIVYGPNIKQLIPWSRKAELYRFKANVASGKTICIQSRP